MGFMDAIKKKAGEAQQIAEQAVSNKLAEHEQKQIEKADAKQELAASKQEQAELKAMFRPTRTMGDVSVDASHKLFKVRRATANIKKDASSLAKTSKALLAVSTLGASAAIEHAMQPDDHVFRFDEIRSFELLEDDSQIIGGGAGAAIAGGIAFGAAGMIAGSNVGKKKTTKTVDNLLLKINLRSFDLPCVIIPYITKKTSVNSKDYAKALSEAQQTISCLELILSEIQE